MKRNLLCRWFGHRSRPITNWIKGTALGTATTLIRTSECPRCGKRFVEWKTVTRKEWKKAPFKEELL